jgi:aerobic carbon-monoxide dehydrogenase medium subunit
VQVPAAFDYSVANSVDDALALLQRYGSDARVMAGGHSLLPLMKLRLASPSVIIDISKLDSELRYIRRDGDGFRVGALTTHRDLLENAPVAQYAPLLIDAESVIADPLVRNLGTVGGSVAHGDPAEDLSAAFVALRAVASVRGPSGSREIPIDAFYIGPYTTALEDGEIVTEIRWTRDAKQSAYLKVERRYGDYAAAAIGVVFDLESGRFKNAGIGMCGVGPTTLPATQAQNFLEGKSPDPDVLRQAGELAAQAERPACLRIASPICWASYALHLTASSR